MSEVKIFCTNQSFIFNVHAAVCWYVCVCVCVCVCVRVCVWKIFIVDNID